MEIAYNILHLFGAVCLITQSIVFTVFILRWWGKIKRMYDSVECLWGEEKRRISSSVRHGSIFTPTPESETIGARVTTKEEYDAMLENLDVLEKKNNGLPQIKSPPPPPPPKGNESF